MVYSSSNSWIASQSCNLFFIKWTSLCSFHDFTAAKNESLDSCTAFLISSHRLFIFNNLTTVFISKMCWTAIPNSMTHGYPGDSKRSDVSSDTLNTRNIINVNTCNNEMIPKRINYIYNTEYHQIYILIRQLYITFVYRTT